MGTITSNDYFIVNGVSSETVGLYVDTPPVPPMAQQRVTTWQTGIDFDSHSPDDVYENIELTFVAFAFQPDNFDFSSLYAFLANARTLQFSRFPLRYFKVVQVGAIQPVQRYDGNRIEFAITFICEPFKYYIVNPETDINPQHAVVENPGTRYSRPIYKITHPHNGNVILSVNGQALTINYQASSPIFIDTSRMIAYDSDGVNQTKYTSGTYPFLSSGNNLVSAVNSGGYTVTLAVTGNWRDY